MIHTNFIKIAFILTLINFSFSTDVDLLNLKTHWVGVGSSFLYPKHIKILSNKLKKQSGFMTSHNIFPAGDTWDLKGRLKIKCDKPSTTNEEENDVGLGVFLTKNNPKSSIVDYFWNYSSEIYGMSHEIDGLSLLFTKNNLYTGLFNSKEATRDDMMNRSKVCKAYLQKTGEILFSVKYRSRVLGVYISEEKEQYEHLCYQFTDIDKFDEFFFSVSGSDKAASCSADLTDLNINTLYDGYQFVLSSQKKAEEFTFAKFPDASNTKKRQELEHFHKVYDFYRDNAKIFAQSLLTFADYNEKEVVHQMKSNIQKTEKAIDDAISIVELEARQIEALNNLLSSERRSVTTDVNETLEQILKWLATMDSMFDKVDMETQGIHAMLAGMNFDDKLGNLIQKVTKVGENLSKAIGATKKIMNPSKLDDLDVDQIAGWKKDIDNLQSNVNEKITRKAEKKMTKLSLFFSWVLGIIAVSILGAFVVIYCKIQTAIRNKRIL